MCPYGVSVVDIRHRIRHHCKLESRSKKNECIGKATDKTGIRL